MSNEIELFIKGSKGCWRVGFTIGVQHFTIAIRPSKKEANWYAKMLRTGFNSTDAKVKRKIKRPHP